MKGTGVTLHRCKGEPLADCCNLFEEAIDIGGIGYIVIGSHFRVQGGTMRNGRLLPVIPQEMYCLERVHDGERRDIVATQVDLKYGVESINAMEVLARVKRGHGIQRPQSRPPSG